jgi:hypothetical protein
MFVLEGYNSYLVKYYNRRRDITRIKDSREWSEIYKASITVSK